MNYRAVLNAATLLQTFIVLARFAFPMALLVGCAPTAVSRPAPDLAPAKLEMRQRFLAELDGMELERLYVLDPHGLSAAEPGGGAARFRGYAVAREAEPAAGDRRAGRAHRGLRNIMEATSAVAAACFEPGHGARFRGARGVFDVLVCFGCNNYMIYGENREDVLSDSFEAADAKPWFQAFKAAAP